MNKYIEKYKKFVYKLYYNIPDDLDNDYEQYDDDIKDILKQANKYPPVPVKLNDSHIHSEYIENYEYKKGNHILEMYIEPLKTVFYCDFEPFNLKLFDDSISAINFCTHHYTLNSIQEFYDIIDKLCKKYIKHVL